MTSPILMTDNLALSLHRARAKQDAMFLHEAAADEIKHRLELVNMPFTSKAVVSGFPDFWSQQLPGAVLAPADDVLKLEQSKHNLVVHAMALHWANDPVGQLIQCRRALVPDGLFLGISFGGQTLHELRACLAEAESEISGGLSPRVAPMAELRDLGGLLQRAGFALPVADAITLKVAYSDAWHLMHDLRAMGENNALETRLRRPTNRRVLDRAATLYHENFNTDEGRITATFELIALTGWAPADSQPKPLRPGSAKHRLADALETEESKLPN